MGTEPSWLRVLPNLPRAPSCHPSSCLHHKAHAFLCPALALPLDGPRVLVLVCPFLTELLFQSPPRGESATWLPMPFIARARKGKSPKLCDMKRHWRQNNFGKKKKKKSCCVPYALRNTFQIFSSAFPQLLGWENSGFICLLITCTYFSSWVQNFILINTLLLLTDSP